MAMTDRLYPSNAKDAKHIHAMIMSGHVSFDGRIYDETESEDSVEPREGDSRVLHWMVIAAMKRTLLKTTSLGRTR
jgi:hypothetical protein